MTGADGHEHVVLVEPRPRNPLTLLLMGLIRGYQLIVSPWYPPRCKYYPSCSAYALTALRVHGVVKGTGLAAWRLLRCNPWSLGGVDLVPPRSGSPPADHAVTPAPDLPSTAGAQGAPQVSAES
jgi:putative membrane protein insertion efficiency factor